MQSSEEREYSPHYTADRETQENTNRNREQHFSKRLKTIHRTSRVVCNKGDVNGKEGHDTPRVYGKAYKGLSER